MRTRVLAIATALLAAAALLAVTYDGRIVPGVRVAGMDLGGLTAAEARVALVQRTAGATVTLTADGLAVRLDKGAGLAPDVDAAVADALAVGRSGPLADRARDLLASVTLGRDIALRRYVVDPERFRGTIDLVAATVERPSVEGDVRFGPSGASVREPQSGIALDRSALIAAVLAADAVHAIVRLPLSITEPVLDRDAIAPAVEAARNAELPLVLVAGTQRTVVERARLASQVRLVRMSGPDGDELVAEVAAEGLDDLVREVADALDGQPREAVLVPGGERLTVIEGRDGVVVDRVAARAVVAEAIFATDRVVPLPASIAEPALTTVAAQRIANGLVLGGTYTTYFPENPARATNIGVAARTFDGMIVAAGSSFSFWERIGEVSPRTGYVSAGTIIGGMSSYAIGGGLCQVSTTLFNAVARAGYQIDERHPHSYYIERYPLGLDAAVFAPSTDLRWTNDTAGAALIRAAATDTSVTFWIYSAPTGRRVEFSDPRQWNVVWPPASQPADPGHAPGYVVPGRDTLVVRTVFEGEAVVHRDEWYSHYAPVWGGPAR